MALFFFYLVVRGNDISIVNSVLDADEIDGTENESEGLTETTYARTNVKPKRRQNKKRNRVTRDY